MVKLEEDTFGGSTLGVNTFDVDALGLVALGMENLTLVIVIQVEDW